MTETDPRHPGRDQELVERFVLGRLPSPERAALENHLSGCDDCRALIEHELRLAAGIKRAGREDLLGRLRERLGQERHRHETAPPPRAVPWPRVLAIAASLLLLAGIGVVQFWLSPGEKETRIPEISQQVPAKSAEAESETLPAKPLPKEGAEPVNGAPYRAKGVPMKSVTPTEMDAAGGAPPQAATSAQMKDRIGFADAKKETSGEGFLVEGDIVEGVTLQGEMIEEPSKMKNDRANAAEGKAAPTITAARQDAHQVVQLSQQAGGNVFNNRQLQQARRRHMSARLQNVNDRLQITLYPDTPFSQESLQRARIEPIGNDSLRVTIGEQMILYRIPQELRQQIPVR